MANAGQPSYRLNLNRNPTRKWAEAQQVDYGGDDWGDEYEEYGRPEPAPVSAGPQRHPGWGQRGGQEPQRSFTNPSLAMGSAQPLFDRSGERRYFSTSGYDPNYDEQSTHARMPPEQDASGYANQAALHVNTQLSGQSIHPVTQPLSQGNRQTDAYGVPFSAPAGKYPPHLHSESTIVRSDGFDDIPTSTKQGGGVNTSKTMLGQEEDYMIHSQHTPSSNAGLTQNDMTTRSQNPSDGVTAKPLPFIRPADIYKRVPEELEKERRSQESSRPSIDSSGSKNTGSPTRVGNHSPSRGSNVGSNTTGREAEIEGPRKLRSTLDSVAERRSEYGSSLTDITTSFSPDNSSMAKSATVPEATSGPPDAERPHMVSRTASSVYTDTFGPNSAGSMGNTAFPYGPGSSKTPILESPLQQAYTYSPSTSKPSGLVADASTTQPDEDLPHFNQGIPQHQVTSSNTSNVNKLSEGLKVETRPTTTKSLNPQQHNSSGYESVVAQAFDPESHSTFSPTSASDTLPRSESNMTSDISPIIGRNSGAVHEKSSISGVLDHSVGEKSGDNATFQPSQSKLNTHATGPFIDNTTLPATTFVPGYRRSPDHPSTEEGKARRPLSVEVPPPPEAQEGVVSAVTAPSASMQGTSVGTLPATHYTPSHTSNDASRQLKSQNELVPPPTSRTASEDWHDWQAQRRQFNATYGIGDSTSASPALSSPTSRAESPTKGTVRDIAGRLESNSGRSSPANTNAAVTHSSTTANKPPQARNDSFRPALPGGWLSYTTSESGRETPDNPVMPHQQQHPLVQHTSSTQSTDSIPTAKAPRQWQSSQPGPVEAAFAAAAAAGNAMAGAFSGPAFAKRNAGYSDTDSDTEDASSTHQARPPEFSETRDFAQEPAHSSTSPPASQASMVRTAPVLANTPHSGPHNERSTDVDFPAPLRTSRIFGDKQPSPRLSVAPVIDDGKPQDYEQLQHDIEQSLTPKTSNVAKATESHHTSTRSIDHQPISVRPISSTSDDDVLPREYSSYWDEEKTPTRTQHEKENLPSTSPSVVRPPIPTTIPPADNSPKEPRSFLEPRYSWEKDGAHKTSEPAKPNFAVGQVDNQPSTPPHAKIQPPSTMSPPTPIVHKTEDDHHNILPSGTSPTASTPARNVTLTSFPQPKSDFKSILSFKDPSQRIRAFDENRQTYAEPNGLLEQWLISMNTQEHSDILRASQLPRTQAPAAQVESRPSPRRDTTGTSGTKQMQEDGKRLLAAAGKYGGKAGIAAKGLFARGKDKLRTASSSDKDFSTHRRRSSSFEINTSSIPRAEEPVLSERAPQIPTPALSTPIGEPSWSTLSTKIDQMFMERAPTSNATTSGINTASSTGPAKGAINIGGGSGIPNISATHTEQPPSSVVASLPGSNTRGQRSEAFPNYGIGVETPKPGIATAVTKENQRSSATNMDTIPKVSTETDRPIGRERVDSLSVPGQRRPSSVSEVSDISAPHDGTNDSLPRNVSPALENQSRAQVVPVVFGHPRTKEEEAQQNSHRISSSGNTLPAYSVADNNVGSKKQTRIAPGAKIVPVAEMKSLEPEDNRQASSRPFSFFGSETLNHAMSQQVANTPQPNVVARTSTDDSTRDVGVPVDLEKSPQPNITEHPAYRTSAHDQTTIDTNNPLPSSRRSPLELEQARQRQQIIVPQREDGEEGYRIPGPYVQEYRSPRTSKPTLNQGSAPSLHNTAETSPSVSQPSQSWAPGDTARAGMAVMPSQIENRPDTDRGKGRSFGGLFRTRSRSQTRRQGQEAGFGPTTSTEYVADEGKKRKGFFGLGNRQSSPTRHAGEGRTEYAPTNDQGRGRKLSMDLLKSSAFGAKSPTDTKKKRSSGFGAFFGKSGNRDREAYPYERSASALSLRGPQQSFGVYDQKTNQVQYPTTQSATPYDPRHIGQAIYQPEPHHVGAANGQFGTPPTAYQETRVHQGSGQQHIEQGHQQSSQRQPEPDRPQIYDHAPYGSIVAVPTPHNAYQAGVESGAPTSTNPTVLNTHASRDVSYGQDRPYVPPTIPKSGRGTSPAGNKADMADHVKNLHKRSRSPRLGRPPSDEHLKGAQIDPSHSAQTRQALAPDPASQLGVFNSKKMSPGGGVPRSEHEQEKPWTIGLPPGDEDDHSDGDGAARNRHLNLEQPGQRDFSSAGSATVSPSTPHQHVQHGGVADMVSPMTAVEPRHQRFDTVVSQHQHPYRHDDSTVRGQGNVGDKAGAEQISVPPSISNAGQIPNPNPQPANEPTATTAPTPKADIVTNVAPSSPSSASRQMKQAIIERTPATSQPATTTNTRPLTVAEKVMGIQPAARGTLPEHRSTTPTPHSPAPSVGAAPKTSTTWPDQTPSTIAMSTTNTSGTTVTTTTMRTGSKLGRSNVQTNTYVIDSKTPSTTGSNTVSNGNGNANENIQAAAPTAIAPQPVPAAANTTNNSNLRVATSSKGLANGARNVPAGKSFDAVELPGSRPDGYESEEEVVMSATAYPGQEWIPDFAHGVSWDDSDEKLV